MTPEEKLKELGLTLPQQRTPSANYLPFKIHGNTLYLAGQGPRQPDGSYFVGKVGRDFTWEQAYQHARVVGLQLLATCKAAVGELSRIEPVKMLGMVNAVPEFTDQPKVINGCSDLFVEVFGERGKHARSAVGMGSLPNGMSLEIEGIMRILD